MKRALAACAAALALLTAAGCGTGENATDAAPAHRADGGLKEPLQTANGPIAPPPATSPLTLTLTGVPDTVRIRFGRQPVPGCCSTSTPARCCGARTRRGSCRSPASRRS